MKLGPMNIHILYGIWRKIGAALLVLAVFGWVIYLVGFGMRNTEYDKRADDKPLLADADYRNAGKPEFAFHWFFAFCYPVMFGIAVCYNLPIQCIKKVDIARILQAIAIPIIFVLAGGVFFFDGIQVYQYHNLKSVDDIVSYFELIHIQCTDTAQGPDELDIYDQDSYVLVELTGTFVIVLSMWAYSVIALWFSDKSVIKKVKQSTPNAVTEVAVTVEAK